MKNNNVLIAIFLFSFGSITYASSLQFNQDDLQRFSTTNSCPGCDLSNAIINGDHSQANLKDADLSNAKGSYINLAQSNLVNANLSNSNFDSANFSQADFSGAGLYQADFSFANLYKANITVEQLAELKSVCNATLPDGSKGSCQ